MRTTSLYPLAAFILACGTDNSNVDAVAGNGGLGAESAGASGSFAKAGSGGTSGNGASSGSASGGAPPSGGAGASPIGSAGSLSPTELRDATNVQCAKGCTLANKACPDIEYLACQRQCNLSVSDYYRTGRCGLEFFQAWSCVNTLTAQMITCTPSGPVFHGCTSEQARYTACPR